MTQSDPPTLQPTMSPTGERLPTSSPMSREFQTLSPTLYPTLLPTKAPSDPTETATPTKSPVEPVTPTKSPEEPTGTPTYFPSPYVSWWPTYYPTITANPFYSRDESATYGDEEVAAPTEEGLSKKKKKEKKALRKQVLEEAINADSAAGKMHAGLPLTYTLSSGLIHSCLKSATGSFSHQMPQPLSPQLMLVRQPLLLNWEIQRSWPRN